MKINRLIITALSVVCALSIFIMIFVLCDTTPNKIRNEFIPPTFDVNAIIGIPDVPEDLGWTELCQDGMNYKVGICGKLIVDEAKRADVYLFNSEDNNVWLKLRILDENDNILCESGLIKPGEYVKTVKFNTSIDDNQKVKLKVMAYQPDTYYSEGSIILNTNIQNGG